MTEHEQMIAEIKVYGFTLVDDVLSADEVEEMKEALIRCQREHGTEHTHRGSASHVAACRSCLGLSFNVRVHVLPPSRLRQTLCCTPSTVARRAKSEALWGCRGTSFNVPGTPVIACSLMVSPPSSEVSKSPPSTPACRASAAMRPWATWTWDT